MPNLTINGVAYSVPDQGTEPPWGDDLFDWCSAVTSGMLQKAGGTFTLTADVDFGATYGLKSTYYKSRAANLSSAGILRLGNNESIGWRNQGDSADLLLKANTSNKLEFNSVELVDLSTAQTLSNKTYSGFTASRVMIANGSGNIAASSVTDTTLSYLDATSSIQTQLNGKLPTTITTTGDLIYSSSGTTASRLAIGSAGQVLTVSGGLPVWSSAPGTGDVVGPGSSTDNALPRFDGTGGKTLQGSGVTVDDSNNVTVPGNLSLTNNGDLSVAGEVTISGTGTHSVTSQFSNEVLLESTKTVTTDGTDPGARGMVISASSSTYTRSTTGKADVTNLSVTLTTTGNPVELYLIAGDSANECYVSIAESDSGGSNSAIGDVYFIRDSTDLCKTRIGHSYVLTSGTYSSATSILPPSAFFHLDTPTAGTYTYKVAVENQDSGQTLSVYRCKLVAKEVKD